MALRALLSRYSGGNLAKDSIIAISAQFCNSAFSLVTAVIFARMLGASEFGAYTVAFAWATLLAVFGRLGLGGYITREFAVALDQQDWRHGLGMLLSVLTLVIAASSSIAIFVYGTFLWIDPALDSELKRLIGYSCFLIPALSLEALLHNVLKAAGHNSVAVVLRFVVRPMMLIAVLLAALYLDYPFTGREALGSQTGTILLGTLFLMVAAVIALPRLLFSQRPVFNFRTHGVGGLPFLALAGLDVLIGHTDVIMLGFLSTTDEAGLYRVASRVAGVVLLVMVAVSLPLGPRLAVLHRQARYDEFRSVFRGANLFSFGLALPLCVAFVALDDWLLSIFGDEFKEASLILMILALSALFSVFVGPVALCLNMMGKERLAAAIMGSAAVLNIVLNFLLIPAYGAMGASIATAITTVVSISAMAYAVYREVKLLPYLLALLTQRGGVNGIP